MDTTSQLNSHSPIVQRALRLRASTLLHTTSYAPQESAEAGTRQSIRQEWNKLQMAPACGVLLTCSAKSQ